MVTVNEIPASPTAGLEPILEELKERRDEATRLREEVETLKTQVQSEFGSWHQNLQEERSRFEVSHVQTNIACVAKE